MAVERGLQYEPVAFAMMAPFPQPAGAG
jgi:hypothetical protein